MLLHGNNNVITRIITAYFPTVSASAGGAYSQQLEFLVIMKIQNDPRNQSWIDINTEISKGYIKEKKNILGDWNGEASYVNTLMGTHGLTNTICNLHGYSDYTIAYQQSKDWTIIGIYCSASLTTNQGGLLSFGRLVGDHRALRIKINENRLLGFWQHDIIPPM